MKELKTAEIFPGLIVGPNDTFADIGCGLGEMCVRAGNVGAAVHAVDTSRSTLDFVATQMKDVPYRSFSTYLADSDYIPIADECASVIICTEVLEHVGDADLFMKELFRIGQPGAHYIISTPDYRSEEVLKILAPDSMWQSPNHVRVFGKGQLYSLAEKAGLSVLEERFLGFSWSIWWALRFAIETDYCPGSPGLMPPVLAKWEETWSTLINMPNGTHHAIELDRALPKSVVISAQKPKA